MKKTILLVFLASLCILTSVYAQERRITGKVTSMDDGTALPGVNVVIKGTTTGTVTDADGNYSLSISGSNQSFVFSFIGLRTEEVPIGDKSIIDVALSLDVMQLSEVVVSGLATTVKRTNLANAIVSVDAAELMGATNPQTVDYALYGKVTGVNMNSNGGAPGGGVSVNFRGISTLGAGSSQPLYIVDGVYVNNTSIRTGRTEVSGAGAGSAANNQDDGANRIADLNPDDIERVEVLKGPSAAAIYGTRANAGVIIITTKKGQKGRTKVSFNQDLGIAKGQNLNFYDSWDANKINTFFSAASAPGQLAAYNQAVSEGRLLDLEKEFYGETGFLTNSQISLTGGGESTTFFVSAGLQDESGIIKNTGFKRYSIRANVEQKISKRIKFSLNTNYVKSDADRGFTGNQNDTGGSLGYAIAYTKPYARLLPDAQGNYPDNPYFNDNPFAIRDLATNNQEVNRFITAGTLNVDLWQKGSSDLRFVINGGVDYLSGNSLIHFPEVLQHQRALANPGDVMWGRQDDLNANVQGLFVFNTSIGKTNLSSQVGAVRLDQDSEYSLIRGRGLAGGQTNLRWAKVVSTQSQLNQRVTDVGIYAQQEVNMDDKLIGTVGIRLDKSTLNLDQSKFYPFAKASLAANITSFEFWTVEAVNQLKLRVAFGQSGGLPQFGNTFESLTPQLIGGFLGGQVSARSVDPNLKPETSNELEFGVDAAFFENKITLEATYYNKKVNDLILDLEPAESTGITAIATNAADLENKGIELALSATPVSTSKLSWLTRLSWWRNRAEITRMDIPTFTTGGFGPALGSYLIAEGYSPTTIVGNPADPSVPGGFSVIGDRQADFDMTFYNNFTFLKNFEFSFLMHMKQGGDNINLSALLWDDGGTTVNWAGDNDGDGTPNGLDRLLQWAADGETKVYVQDASYLKLREIGLYYNVPKSIYANATKGAISKIKVGVSANNILVSTKYDSYDPEVSNFGSQPVNSNVEVAPYPSARRLFFHLSVDF
jgi:TonB-dependent starch-binding outer membrane protein SusC